MFDKRNAVTITDDLVGVFVCVCTGKYSAFHRLRGFDWRLAGGRFAGGLTGSEHKADHRR